MSSELCKKYRLNLSLEYLSQRAGIALDNDDGLKDVTFLFDDGNTYEAHKLILALGSTILNNVVFGGNGFAKPKDGEPIKLRGDDYTGFSNMIT